MRLRRASIALLAVALSCDDATGPNGALADAIVAGRDFSCALASGRAYCWGANAAGQLGRVTSGDSAGPAAVAGGHQFRLLAASDSTACGVATDDKVWCWGYGRIFGTTDVVTSPILVDGVFATPITSIGVGYSHGCVLSGGAATCFGTNTRGELGMGSTSAGARGATAVTGGHSFSQLSVGAFHTCGVEGVSLWCWGTNFFFSMGSGSATPSPTPRKLTLSFEVASVEAGSADTCALDGSSQAWCWGADVTGQLGRGAGSASQASATATLVSGVPNYQTLAMPRINSTASHTCGVSSSGKVLCWGLADSAQLGRAPTETCISGSGPVGCSPAPAAIASTLSFKQLALGRDHTCGLTTQGEIYCWGADSKRQLGGTSGVTSATPVRIILPE
jgi:alpha-tubulin suppressor-like RCC1 family protein